MTRIGMGFVGAVALVSAACASSTRSGKAEASGGRMIETAAEAGGGSRPDGAASAPSDASSAGGATKVVEGRVELVDRANNLTLSGTEQVGHAFVELKTGEDTKVTVDGAQATLADVNPGDEVRASFSDEGGELRVERLEVVSSSGASEPAGSADQR